MMNTASLPEMLNCLNAATVNGAATALKDGADASVLERQRAALKWQQEQLHIQLQQQQFYLNEFNMMSLPSQAQSLQGMISLDGPSPRESGWPHFGSRSGITSLDLEHSGARGEGSGGVGYGLNYAPPRTISGQEPIMVAAGDATEKLSVFAGKESFKKRKPEKSLPPQVNAEQDDRTKKLRSAFGEKETRCTDQQKICSKINANNQNNSTSTSNNNNNNESKNREASGCTSKENSKASVVQNPDYIHVRARRGQATDSHSLAERVRREKISERMKYLQDLVPGCNKITGKAGMLDEIINYVQSLQRQVEFLSMKLAAVNPRLDFNIENLFAACSATQLAAVGITPNIVNQSFIHYNHPTVQSGMPPVCSSELGGNPMGMNIGQANSATISLPDTFADSSSFNVQNPLPWEAELHNIFAMEYFQRARSNALPSQIFTGPVNEASSLKMEL